MWTMPPKIYKPEEIIAKSPQVEVLTSQGESAVDAIRSITITDATFYRWRREYGGPSFVQLTRAISRANSSETSRGFAPSTASTS